MTRALVADQGADVVRNLADSDAAWTPSSAGGWGTQWFGSGGGAGDVSYVAGAGPAGSGVVRKTWSAAGGGLDIGVTYNFPRVFKPNTTYTFSAGIVATFATGHVLSVVWYDASGTAIAPGTVTITGPRASAATTPGQRVRLIGSTVSPAGAVFARLVWGPYPVLIGASYVTPIAGDVIDGYLPMAVEGPYSGDFTCASTPGAGWTKLADGTSIGYEYTLSRASGGRRYWMVDGVGSIKVPDLGAMTGRALFGVYTADGTMTAGYQTTTTYGDVNNTGGMKLQGNSAGNVNTGFRVDTLGGQLNAVTYGLGRDAGWHVFSGYVDYGMTRMQYRVDGAALGGQSVYPGITPGGGMPGQLTLASVANPSGAGAEFQGKAAVLVEGQFTDAVELAIVAWLQNHYAVAPVPSGPTNKLDSGRLDTMTLG